MALKLTYLVETSVPVEIEGLTPDWACDQSLAQIERFEIFHGNRKVPLAELFTVSGDPADKRFDFEGNLAGVHWIGAHMQSGEVYIHGPAGRHVGSEMRGGRIVVAGDVGGWVGCEMRGGLIHVRGNAGHLAGAAYRGSAKGMTGGTLLVDGNAGNEIGHSMQKGTIAIGGQAGDMLGFNMTDGAILVFGDCGIRAGAGMRGGTIALLGPLAPPLLPSFRFVGAAPWEKLAPLFDALRHNGFQPPPSWLPATLNTFVGDLVVDGTGEIHLRHPAESGTAYLEA